MAEIESELNGESPLGFSLRLRSLKSTRSSYARLIRERARGNVPDKTFKSLIWALAQYFPYLKAETEEDMACRIEALEKAIMKEKK